MQVRTRKILYAVVLAAVAAGIVALFLPSPIDVDVASVTSGPLVVTVDEDGETRAHDRFVVSAPVAGRVSRIELHEGDPVKARQVVAEIWPVPLTARERDEQLARIESAKALSREATEQVHRAKNEYEQAQRERKRMETLVQDGFVSSFDAIIPSKMPWKVSAAPVAALPSTAAEWRWSMVRSEWPIRSARVRRSTPPAAACVL